MRQCTSYGPKGPARCVWARSNFHGGSRVVGWRHARHCTTLKYHIKYRTLKLLELICCRSGKNSWGGCRAHAGQACATAAAAPNCPSFPAIPPLLPSRLTRTPGCSGCSGLSRQCSLASRSLSSRVAVDAHRRLGKRPPATETGDPLYHLKRLPPVLTRRR